MFITEAMVSRELIIEDHMSEFKRIPLKYLPEEIGKVSAPSTPPPCQPFGIESPYKLDPADFYTHECECGCIACGSGINYLRDDCECFPPESLIEQADEVVNATPEGEEIHFDLIVEKGEQ
jgi:hypothetical protein